MPQILPKAFPNPQDPRQIAVCRLPSPGIQHPRLTFEDFSVFAQNFKISS